jgi:hypothetical protein
VGGLLLLAVVVVIVCVLKKKRQQTRQRRYRNVGANVLLGDTISSDNSGTSNTIYQAPGKKN